MPWHLWDLFEYYPEAEVAFSCLSSQRFKRSERPYPRILIILGNSEGINVAVDEKLLKQYCQKAETVVLVEPTPAELNKHLWDEKGWDILFFSGHSRTELTKGRIFLNRTDSLTMDELRYGLQTAVMRGLQLAFFNSCDGLGIAAELESLHIPQVIVMREPVPDRVAHQFLKDFFQEFTARQSFYQSVNIARKRLQGLEQDYPCASWLPVIVQNLLETPPTWQSLGVISNCPYPGLAAFREEDAPYFYGREGVIQKLVTAVIQKSLVAVIGASGSGKSSVVFAGLIPQLKQDKKHDWLIASFRPGNNPLQSLAIALTPLTEGRSSDEQITYQQRLANLELEVELKASILALQNLIESITTASPKSHVVVIADQFEELYTLCNNAEERKIFLDNLLNAVEKVPGFTLVLTLRADFFGEALSYRRLADALEDAQLNFSPLNAQELEAAIQQPAYSLDVQLEPGLTQRLIDVVLESPSYLPLLEFTLTQLWQKQRQGWLTHEAYADIGGVETALAVHAEGMYAQLSLANQQTVQQIFIQLVQPTETSADIRRLATREEVGEENWELVARLADARLVVTNCNEITKVETVEIIHEALIKNWRRLRQWMRIDGDFRRWQEQLRAVMRQWESSDHDVGALLRGKPLIDAEEWLRQRSMQMSPSEQTFINLSLEARHNEQQEKKAASQRILIGLTGGLIVAILLAGVALYQRQQSQINEIKALSLSTKILLKFGNEVEASVPLLGVIQKLEELKFLDARTKIDLTADILENINQIREYNRLEGHKGNVNSVSFSPDSRLLASASQDTTIKIWRRNGHLLQTLSGHKDGVFKVIFSPNSQFLLAASFDNTITCWRYNLATGLFEKHPFVTILETDGLWAIALSPNGNIIATANHKGQVKLRTLDGKFIKTIPAHSQRIWSVSFSPDGQSFATASADKTVKLWNLEGKLLKILQGDSGEVFSVNFSPDGNTLASASKDKIVRIWNLAGQVLYPINDHTDEVLDARFSPDGNLLASASADNTVKIWSVKEDGVSATFPLLLYTFPGHGGKASEVNFSPDGQSIATASGDRTVKLWRLQGILPAFTGNSVSISPDGKTVAVGNQQGIVTLRQRDGSLLRSFMAHKGEIVKVAFHPKGKNLVTIGTDNQIKLWNLDGKLINNWQGHESVNQNAIPLDPVKDVIFSPDGNKIVTIGGIDKQVKVWNLEGTLLKSWHTEDNFLTSINFSPNGQILTTAGDKIVKLWNLDGKLLQSLTGYLASFSPDGKIIATASADQTVKLWYSHSGKLLRTLHHNDNVYSVDFSPDSQVLVSASADKITFWTLDGQLLHTLQGNQGNKILEVNFSSDGNIIASVDDKHNIILWNLDINNLQHRVRDWFSDYSS